ncbi:hypothetical protein Bpfe_020253 [Biomphalaria pfeifferi]|uniref:Uncharacterized protein n=1 Tax=Biomphalaria pfeifferi TaxID=112525 RepID=A0AAD8B9B6_BIOPF|nr:hypothetical protein Bpfe_020253 [Biomphalaria pfeifferi]
MYRVERKETNEETEDCYVPEAFVPVVPVTSTLTEGICTSTIIIDIGIDECQSNHSKSELSGGRHSSLEPEETYILDVKLLSEEDCGALDFVCNVAACEPAAPLRGVCREGLLRQRVRSTAVLKKTVLDTISLCVKRPRHRRNNSLINWRKRKRHQMKTVLPAARDSHFLYLLPT